MMDKYLDRDWTWIVVNSSGGKDSQTALRMVVKKCDKLEISRSRIVVSHQCLGRVEWPGTLDLVRAQADHYGLRVEVSRYRDRRGKELDLLDYVRRRDKWPSSSARYCTSEFKRGPGGRVLTALSREKPGPVLNVYGFRSEESPARAKKKVFARNVRFTTKSRDVYDWLPILNLTEIEVWKSISSSTVPHHYAYDLGMRRLSCCFCIFATQDDLKISSKANPELFAEYCDLEDDLNHAFQHGKPLR